MIFIHRLTKNSFGKGMRCYDCYGNTFVNSLSTDCPGYELSEQRLEQISDGKIDFINGVWKIKAVKK